MSKTVKDLATEALEQFREEEASGERGRFYVMKDDRPDWLFNLVYKAHGDMLPDDYKFKYVVDALEALAEHEDEDDAIEAIGEADIYNHELLKWFGSNANRWGGYVEDALENMGGKLPDTGIMGLIQYGQALEREEVFGIVLQELKEMAENGCSGLLYR